MGGGPGRSDVGAYFLGTWQIIIRIILESKTKRMRTSQNKYDRTGSIPDRHVDICLIQQEVDKAERTLPLAGATQKAVKNNNSSGAAVDRFSRLCFCRFGWLGIFVMARCGGCFYVYGWLFRCEVRAVHGRQHCSF